MMNISFDTCFLNKVKEGRIDIDEIFPLSKYRRWVQDTFFDEFFFDNFGVWYNRTVASEFYNRVNLHVFGGEEIILGEYKHGSKYSLSENKIEQERIINYLKGKCPDQAELEARNKKLRDERHKSKVFQWSLNSINPSTTDNEIIININDIELEIKIVISDNVGLNSAIKDILDIVLKNPFSKQVKEIKNFKAELPTFYNIIFYSCFIDLLKRPKSILNRTQKNIMNPFKIKLYSNVKIRDHYHRKDEIIEYIELSENFLPDFRISLLGIHYIDRFATCDKNLAALLIYLYPQYESKVLWFNSNI